MKYLLFAGEQYYAMSARHALVGGFESATAAVEAGHKLQTNKNPININGKSLVSYTDPVDWWQVINTETLKTVHEFGCAYGDHDNG